MSWRGEYLPARGRSKATTLPLALRCLAIAAAEDALPGETHLDSAPVQLRPLGAALSRLLRQNVERLQPDHDGNYEQDE